MATKKRGCPCTLNEEEGCGLAMVLARKDWIMTKYRSIVSVFVEIGIEALWK
jgi:TPP-dependent pyruvate/acetoin dehydrogenase alpha subunit